MITPKKSSSHSAGIRLLCRLWPAVLLPAAFMLIAAAGHAQIPAVQTWQSTLHTDHHLTGRIWDAASNQFIDIETLTSTLSSASVLLLGEKHDNPDHHRLRLQLLSDLISTRRVASVTLEMLTTSRQPAIDQAATIDNISSAALRELLNWDEAWNWEFYSAPLHAALEADIPVLAGNLDRPAISAIYAGQIPDNQPLAPEQQQQLLLEIDRSHCGLLPESQFPAMMRVQQARDQQMADALSNPDITPAGIRILLAGNFHVRHDLGVSNYLPQDAGQIVTVAFLEVNPESDDPQDYLEQFSDRSVYDFVWFTPAVLTADYCEQMRNQ